MKKIIFLLLFVLLSIFVLLVGCENQEPVQSDTPDTSASESIPAAEPEQELSEQSQEAVNTESELSEEENTEMKMNFLCSL